MYNINKTPKILIIAPHSNCSNAADKRICDIRSKEIAEKFEEIAKNAGYDVKLILSDELRSKYDYNRIESTETPWRQNIRNYIEENIESPIIIYETHSFPATGTEFDDGSQMALLAIDEYYDETKKLHDYLINEAGIKLSKKINNTRVINLMIDTVKYPNIKHHFLLEFNEDKNIFTDTDSNYAVFKIFLASLFPKCVYFCYNNIITLLVVIILVILLILFIYYFYKDDSRKNDNSD